MRLLLVEDDATLGDALRKWLALDGHAVDWVSTTKDAGLALADHQYDLVLLDRRLPGEAGDALLHRLRRRDNAVPVIMITARDAPTDRIEGLDLGADDYLVKPFDLDELSARIRAVTRRARGQAQQVLHARELELDPAQRRVTLGGAEISLTPKEYAILRVLMQHKGRPVSRSEIEDTLYGWGEEIESNAVEVHVFYLRRKLGGTAIETVRGAGYRVMA